MLESLIKKRNELQFRAEDSPSDAEECWIRLGVANRHIDRIMTGQLDLSLAVEEEITKCFNGTDEWLKSKNL